jgi:hypothetical protein
LLDPSKLLVEQQQELYSGLSLNQLMEQEVLHWEPSLAGPLKE